MSEDERSKWNDRYAKEGASREPSSLVVELDATTPR